MCFSIPRKVIKVTGSTAWVEGNTSVSLGKDIQTRPGEYIQVVGDVAVGTLTQKQGENVRRLIAHLNTNV